MDQDGLAWIRLNHNGSIWIGVNLEWKGPGLVELKFENVFMFPRNKNRGRKSTINNPKEVRINNKKSSDKLASIKESTGAKLNTLNDPNQARPETSLLSDRSASTDEVEKWVFFT